MIQIRPAKERGHADHGWLDTYFTFSFSDYYDPKFMGFRSLRVINEDRVKPGYGFPEHPHRDMEIITYVLEGSLAHKDSMGTGSVIRPGEVQKMSAGTGVRHSEFNHSKSELVHLLQIWILPEKDGIQPMYQQKTIPAEEKRGNLHLIGSPKGGNGSVTISQDVELYATELAAGQSVEHTLGQGRHAWLQVARGQITVNGQPLHAGDGAAISAESKLQLAGVGDSSEALLFDLA
ncbi:MAG TPA: pirin family protein [Candidatus Saccharimonadales bacterium]|jgi:redox-sensitive bicupin YhaK (pirin superfamily)|nr:pirin family protein [Candidatus Saccharimonadales bacterium]